MVKLILAHLIILIIITLQLCVSLQITTLVGTGVANSTGDSGPPLASTLNLPKGIWGDIAGNLYISEADGYRVRKLAVSTNTMSTVIGNGMWGTSIDNRPATSSTIRTPISLFGDSLNSQLYVCDSSTAISRVRMLNLATGIITNFAGSF